MYTRLLCLVVIVFWGEMGFGQLSVSLQEPPGAIVQKSQLWNITLVNSGNNALQVTISLSLFDIQTNQPVMTAFTRPIFLAKGVKQLKAADVTPVDYNYLSPAFTISRLTDVFIPIGNYRACYSFYEGKGESVVLAEDCINLEISPLSPPQLNLPADSAVVETPYPQFNWLPPVPVTLFSDLNYDLLVTEVQPGQSPASAVQENLPVYTGLRLKASVHNYPASYKSLDTGKVYAWRVIAKNGEMFAAQSEIWTFSIGKRKMEPPVRANGAYLELKNDDNPVSTGIIPDNTLGLKFYSYDKTHETVIRFVNEKGMVLKEIKRTIQYGNNFIVSKLDRSFEADTTYFVEITDMQKTCYRASFRMAK